MPQNKLRDIYETLKRCILDGKFEVGKPLPSAPILMKKFGVARATAVAALKALEREGLVESRRGSGTYPVKREPITFGVIVPEAERPFYFRVCTGIANFANSSGGGGNYSLLCSNTPLKTAEQLREFAKMCADSHVAGVFFARVRNGRLNREVLSLFRAAKIPVVLLGGESPSLDLPCDLVGMNYIAHGPQRRQRARAWRTLRRRRGAPHAPAALLYLQASAGGGVSRSSKTTCVIGGKTRGAQTMSAWRTDTARRSAALRLQRRYRQHAHAVGSFARCAIDGNVADGSYLRKPILDFDRHIVGKMGMPFSLTRFGLHTFRSEFSPRRNTFRSEHGDVEYTFSSEFTDKDISNETTNAVDSAGCAYALQRLSYTSKHPPAEVFLDLPKPKPIVEGTAR